MQMQRMKNPNDHLNWVSLTAGNLRVHAIRFANAVASFEHPQAAFKAFVPLLNH